MRLEPERAARSGRPLPPRRRLAGHRPRRPVRRIGRRLLDRAPHDLLDLVVQHAARHPRTRLIRERRRAAARQTDAATSRPSWDAPRARLRPRCYRAPQRTATRSGCAPPNAARSSDDAPTAPAAHAPPLQHQQLLRSPSPRHLRLPEGCRRQQRTAPPSYSLNLCDGTLVACHRNGAAFRRPGSPPPRHPGHLPGASPTATRRLGALRHGTTMGRVALATARPWNRSPSRTNRRLVGGAGSGSEGRDNAPRRPSANGMSRP